MTSMPVRAMGMAWYRRQDYRRILAIMTDADLLPPTYDKWLGKAERYERQEIAKGMMIIRVIIDPDEFAAWCAASGLNIDAKARMNFAAEEAAKFVKTTH